jgi:hypothetical protein
MFSLFFIYSINHGYFDGGVVWFVLLVVLVVIRIVIGTGLKFTWRHRSHKQPLVVSIKPAPKELHSSSYSKFTKKLISIPLYGYLLNSFISKTQKISPYTGKLVNAYFLVNKIAPIFFVLSLGFFVLSLILPLFTGFVFFALLGLCPFLFPYLPSVYFGSEVHTRKVEAEADLPFFLQFVDTLNYVHVLLPQVMIYIKDSKIFPGLVKDSELFAYFTKVGKTDLEAIQLIADHHPSVTLKDFLKRYTSMLRTDVAALNDTISRAVEKSYSNFDQQIKSKENQIKLLLLMVSAVASMGPLVIVIMLKLPSIPAELLLIMLNAFPFVALFLFLSVGTVRAFAGDLLSFYPVTIIVGIFSAIISFFVWDFYVAVATGVSVTCFVNWILTRKQDLEISQIENHIVDSLDKIKRKTELHQDILEIIRWFANDDSFPASFRRVFVRINMNFSLSHDAASSVFASKHPSSMLRLMLFVLYTIYVSSSVNSGALTQFTAMMDKAITAKHKFRASMTVTSCMLILSPIFIVMSYAMMITIFPSDSFVGVGMFNLQIVDDSVISDGLKPSMLFFGIVSGIAVSFNVFSTIRRTLPIAVSTGLAAMGLVFWDEIISLSATLSSG